MTQTIGVTAAEMDVSTTIVESLTPTRITDLLEHYTIRGQTTFRYHTKYLLQPQQDELKSSNKRETRKFTNFGKLTTELQGN